ncbi:MAG: permease, partial [Planctomycetota bacterium]
MEPNLIWTVALLLLAGLGGAALPLLGHFGPRSLHGLVALSAGVFLGSVLHVVADVALAGVDGPLGHEHAGHGHAGHGHGAEPGLADAGLWLGLIGGFVGLFLLRRFGPGRQLRDSHAHDAHALTWRVAYLGLVFHAALAGLGLAPLVGGDLAWGLVGSFAAHKATEVLSLATLMRLAGVGGKRAGMLLAVFVLVTPTSLLLSHAALIGGIGAASWAVGLAGGTFLYVGLVDLLPEAFHESDDRLRPLLFVLAGAVAGAVLPGGDLAGFETVPALTVDVFLELAPFLLFGFAIAGLLSEWLDPKKIEPWLAGERARSVATASVVGAPLPLCSCSVVPVAATLRGAGAGRGATSAFLIATPETGVDSIAVTYGLMGPVMAVARPLAAVLSALGVGALVGRFGGETAVEDAAGETSCCSKTTPKPPETPETDGSCCAHETASVAGPNAGERLRRALRHGFVQMVDDLALPLVLGVVAAGVLAALIPADALTGGALEGPLGYLLMLAIGLPIYVCASASTPLAATLIAKGLSP